MFCVLIAVVAGPVAHRLCCLGWIVSQHAAALFAAECKWPEAGNNSLCTCGLWWGVPWRVLLPMMLFNYPCPRKSCRV